MTTVQERGGKFRDRRPALLADVNQAREELAAIDLDQLPDGGLFELRRALCLTLEHVNRLVSNKELDHE
tara:strand:- start:75 stop:281 length:207 start_codon:yes stop_codon:yes gene_type:complete